MEKTIYKKWVAVYKDGKEYWRSIITYLPDQPDLKLPANTYNIRARWETDNGDIEDIVYPELVANQRVSAILSVKHINLEAQRKKKEELIALLAEYGAYVTDNNGYYLSDVKNLLLSDEKFTTRKEIPVEIEYIVKKSITK